MIDEKPAYPSSRGKMNHVIAPIMGHEPMATFVLRHFPNLPQSHSVYRVNEAALRRINFLLTRYLGGFEGVIAAEESKTMKTRLDIMESTQFERGYVFAIFRNGREEDGRIFEGARIPIFEWKSFHTRRAGWSARGK